MLVLSRRTEQSIKLGPDITVTILSIDGDRVKLGIQAPRDVSVLRQELFDQVHAANTAAVASSSELRRIAALLPARNGE
jgi:carbon storage regulator